MNVYIISCYQYDHKGEYLTSDIEAIVDNEEIAKDYCDKKNLLANEKDSFFKTYLNYYYKEYPLNELKAINRYKITLEEYDLHDGKDIVISYTACNDDGENELTEDFFGYISIYLYIGMNDIYTVTEERLKSIMYDVLKKRDGGESFEKLNNFIKNIKI